MTLVTLVHGGNGSAREAAIAAQASSSAADSAGSSRVGVVIIEGLAGGSGPLQVLEASAVMKVIRVAPGCPCCIGNLTMRTTLNRVLRDKPASLFLAIADARHKDKVRAFLQDAQYREHLALGPELDCS